VSGVSEHPPTDKPPVAGSSASSADRSVDPASNSPDGSTRYFHSTRWNSLFSC